MISDHLLHSSLGIEVFFHEFCLKIIFFFKYQFNMFLKIMSKLVLNTVFGDHDFNFEFKTILSNYGLNFKKI